MNQYFYYFRKVGHGFRQGGGKGHTWRRQRKNREGQGSREKRGGRKSGEARAVVKGCGEDNLSKPEHLSCKERSGV